MMPETKEVLEDPHNNIQVITNSKAPDTKNSDIQEGTMSNGQANKEIPIEDMNDNKIGMIHAQEIE